MSNSVIGKVYTVITDGKVFQGALVNFDLCAKLGQVEPWEGVVVNIMTEGRYDSWEGAFDELMNNLKVKCPWADKFTVLYGPFAVTPWYLCGETGY